MVPMADDVVVDEGKQELVMWLDEDNSERATKNMAQRKNKCTFDLNFGNRILPVSHIYQMHSSKSESCGHLNLI
jgi:hypothetical protein